MDVQGSDIGLEQRLRATEHLDRLRTEEFSRLDEHGHVYLDHTGSGLYPASLVRDHLELLGTHVFGNPHSDNPTSRPMTESVEGAPWSCASALPIPAEAPECIFTPNV